jgi:hypothetical protein
VSVDSDSHMRSVSSLSVPLSSALVSTWCSRGRPRFRVVAVLVTGTGRFPIFAVDSAASSSLVRSIKSMTFGGGGTCLKRYGSTERH